MKRKRRHFSPSFKTKVVLEALKKRQTINQLAEQYELHPNQITTWKKEFLENADKAFSDEKANAEQKDRDKEVEVRWSGRLEIEHHSHLHPRFAEINREQRIKDIEKAFELFENNLSHRPTHFAFPFHSQNLEARKDIGHYFCSMRADDKEV